MNVITAQKKPPSEAAFADTCSRGLGQSYTPSASGRYCPKRPSVMVLRSDPSVIIPASCDSYGCTVCGPRKVAQMAAVVTHSAERAGAVRLVTFTQAPQTHAQRRQKMSNLRRSLVKRGFTWEHAWTAEVSEGGHLHIHTVQWGSTVPKKAVEAAWGSGVDVSRAVPLQEIDRVVAYLTKGFRRALPAALDLNGGRPLHTTRGFHHGLDKRGVQQEMRVNKSTGEMAIWDRVLVTTR